MLRASGWFLCICCLQSWILACTICTCCGEGWSLSRPAWPSLLQEPKNPLEILRFLDHFQCEREDRDTQSLHLADAWRASSTFTPLADRILAQSCESQVERSACIVYCLLTMLQPAYTHQSNTVLSSSLLGHMCANVLPLRASLRCTVHESTDVSTVKLLDAMSQWDADGFGTRILCPCNFTYQLLTISALVLWGSNSWQCGCCCNLLLHHVYNMMYCI